jgi:hypothetical protein
VFGDGVVLGEGVEGGEGGEGCGVMKGGGGE